MSDDETSCEYVGSRGLLKNCASHCLTPRSSLSRIFNQSFDNLNAGDSIYICSAALNDFVDNYLDAIPTRFVLVTGDSDYPVPLRLQSFEKLIQSEKLIAWFSQNLVFSPKQYTKLRHMPIGLDYHTLSFRDHDWGPMSSPKMQEELLFAIKKNAKPFYERLPTAYTTFHFEMHRGNRQSAYHQIPRDLVYYEPERTLRMVSWKNQLQYAFVVSPPGEGIDCHRTWEALCLGCIPILFSTPLDDLFEDLPVLIVKSWINVTRVLLERTVQEYKKKYARGEFRMEKLTLKYWTELIREAGAD